MRTNALLIGILLTLSGCGSSGDRPAADSSHDEPVGGQNHSAVPSVDESNRESVGKSDSNGNVSIRIVSFKELQESISASAGRIVVVDFWSTQCLPCMKEFPHLVELHRNVPESQLRCISVSLDYEGLPNVTVEEASEAALAFLREKEATLENFILNEDSLTVLDEQLKTPSMPIVQIYDIDGMLIHQFDDSTGQPFSYASEVTPFVKGLLERRFPDSDEKSSTR